MEFTHPDQIFGRLWQIYTARNPAAGSIHSLFTDRGETVVNDHIAIRTFNDARMNIDVLASPFLKLGYKPAGRYTFTKKHLNAVHFEMQGQEDAPRVFISELILEKFSRALQDTIRETMDHADPGIWKSDELIFTGNPSGTPSFETYNQLRAESEYAAWLYVYGFRVNHFTVSINGLKGFNGIEEVNEFLKENGILLNHAGGEVKGSRDLLLKQSSTMAEIVPVEFTEGVFKIPSCYYEFAERFRGSDGRLFSGFLADSADRIFESTHYYEK